LSWGGNAKGQLGHHDAHGEATVERPKLVKELTNRHVVGVAAGEYHTCAVTDCGQLFTWGSNEDGQLGHGVRRSNEPEPRLVTSLSLEGYCVRQVACGGSHTAVIVEGGDLYTWGLADLGQLGYMISLEAQYTPINVNMLRKARIVSAGCFHTALVTETGELYTCGYGGKGLGHGDLEDQEEFKMVEALRGKALSSVACGAFHTLALCVEGTLFSFGEGKQGQLGHGVPESEASPKAVSVLEGERIIKITAGAVHSLVVNASGEIFAFGNGTSGQLGLGLEAHQQLCPCLSPLRVCKEKTQRVVGIEAGAYHSMAMLMYEDGHGPVNTVTMLLGWGKNSSNQLGIDPSEPATQDEGICVFEPHILNVDLCGGREAPRGSSVLRISGSYDDSGPAGLAAPGDEYFY